MDDQIKPVIREETLFAGIRQPIKTRAELIPRMKAVRDACGEKIYGPLTHIFRFDTPVDGYDSEIGFPVSAEVNSGDVCTHKLRKLHFLSLMHKGPWSTLRESNLKIHAHLDKAGLSPELEVMEVYHQFDPDNLEESEIETQVSFLAWPEIYREQLLRVLGDDLADEIWQGGEGITPFTLVDERVEWVAASLERLKLHTTREQQFDILSRVALVRPLEEINKFKQIYQESGDPNRILAVQQENLSNTPSGGFIDPPYFTDEFFHLSKVSYDRTAYDAATTPEETRKAFCFCALIREAKDPKVDPIFCYRAAGWARQFWEPILGVEFKQCDITHSILKGDRFCAWNYHLPEKKEEV